MCIRQPPMTSLGPHNNIICHPLVKEWDLNIEGEKWMKSRDKMSVDGYTKKFKQVHDPEFDPSSRDLDVVVLSGHEKAS